MRALDRGVLRFFGRATPGAPRIPIPFGLACWVCGHGFTAADSGVSYEHRRACVVVHRACFLSAAVSGLKKHLDPTRN